MASPSRERGDPNVAVLLTWFLPGAGHAYLGRFGAALLGLALVQGLYLLGWWLGDGRTFEFLDPELRGPFSTLLAPEVGNLGAMMLHLKVSGFGLGPAEPLPFPPWIVLASFATALSGLANLFLAAHAHSVARGIPPAGGGSGFHPTRALVAAWFIPGLGHWLQGRRLRASIVFLLLLSLFAAGTWLAGGSNLSRERHFYYWSGQLLLGGPSMLAELLWGATRVERELPFGDVGLLYACMAGLLNVLAMLDVSAAVERRWAPDGGGSPEVAA
jgi:hypothetical protein